MENQASQHRNSVCPKLSPIEFPHSNSKSQKILGVPLPDRVVVHHTESKLNKYQIEIISSQAEHALKHANERALRECGNEAHRKCSLCHKYDDTSNMVYSKSDRSHQHRKCHADYEYRRRHAVNL